MTPHEEYKDATTWFARAIIIDVFHIAHKFKRKKWGVRETAAHFGISTGLVCEALKLAEKIRDNPEIIDKCKTREEALNFIKRMSA
jgi:hypothetical protein